MRAAGVGVVDGEDVALMHVTVEEAHDVLAGEMQRADMDRDVLIALCGALAAGVMQGTGKSRL